MLAGRVLAHVLKDFPEVEIKKVEFLTNRASAREMGVGSIPALVFEDRTLKGILLTPSKIRSFLGSLPSAS